MFTKFLMAAILTFAISNMVFSEQIITLDHRSKTQNPAGTIRLSDREEFTIVFTNTNDGCFDYNVQVSTPSRAAALPITPKLTVSIQAIHDEKVSAYIVNVKKKTGKPEDTVNDTTNCNLQDYTWTIPVETYGWNLAFAGGFTADGLTDPVFFLEPSGSGGNTFMIREDPKAEDQARLGATAFAHLYHNGPESWHKYWAPISFGLNVTDLKAYYFGSTVKFGSKLFLTGGLVLGEKGRLPDGLQVNGSTTDPNAIKTLGKRTVAAGFVSISFSVLSFDFSVFKNAFMAAPKDKNGNPAGK